jgi:hypothetical protein
MYIVSKMTPTSRRAYSSPKGARLKKRSKSGMPRDQEFNCLAALLYGSVYGWLKARSSGWGNGNGNVASIPNLATLMFCGILCAFENHYDCVFSSTAKLKQKLWHGTCGSPYLESYFDE